MKILIGTRSGGHSIEALGIMKYLGYHEYVIVTNLKDIQKYGTKKYIIPVLRETGKKIINPFNLIKNFLISFVVLIKEQPDLVICCGSNNSIFLGIWGKIFAKKVITLEALNRVNIPSLSPRILSYICDEVWIPNKNLIGYYRGKEKYVGLIHPYKNSFDKFKSKVKTNDLLIMPSTGDNIKSKYQPKNLDYEDLLRLMGKTKIVITRAGIASYEAANLADKVICIPDSREHQQSFARWLAKKYGNVEIKNDFEKEIKKHEMLIIKDNEMIT
jgi:UDP-N-acetylglucosamine:LPS N-acetylglucosamine transferase